MVCIASWAPRANQAAICCVVNGPSEIKSQLPLPSYSMITTLFSFSLTALPSLGTTSVSRLANRRTNKVSTSAIGFCGTLEEDRAAVRGTWFKLTLTRKCVWQEVDEFAAEQLHATCGHLGLKIIVKVDGSTAERGLQLVWNPGCWRRAVFSAAEWYPW